MMVIADTSVWITHFNRNDARLFYLLEEGLVLVHPLIIGEIACGHIRNREEILGELLELPQSVDPSYDESLVFLESHRLYGHGLGFVDVVLLASTALSDCLLLSDDKRLARAAADLEIAFDPNT
jgi:hypothetical protein